MTDPTHWSAVLQLEPVAKAVVKTTLVKGFVRKYTPAKTRNAMNDIRYALQAAGAPLFEGAVSVGLTFYRQRLKKGKKNAYPTTRPDLSNYLKMFEDAAIGILWKDDAQIIHLSLSKRYAERPSIEVAVMAVA